MDSEKVGPQVSRMWEYIARRLDSEARRLARDYSTLLSASNALHFAAMAEAAYWQSTGENDAIDLEGGRINCGAEKPQK